VTAVTACGTPSCYSLDLAGTIEARENSLVLSEHKVIRKLFILIFVLSVANNSLAAAFPYIEGDGKCKTNCCRSARHNEPRATLSKICCLTQCNQPAEAQGVPESTSFSTGRDSKDPGSPSACVVAASSDRSRASLHSPPSNIVQSSHIYLKNGALLI
jgi:hypothetical protein